MAKSKRPNNSPEAVKAAQATHPTMKWFDVFEADPTKKSYYDPMLNELKAVTTEFTLGKKLAPVLIEPELAMGFGKEKGFNHFSIDADKNSGGGAARFYLPKDKFKTGKVLSWPDMAAILQLPKAYPNTMLYARYQELIASGDDGFEAPYKYDDEESDPAGFEPLQ